MASCGPGSDEFKAVETEAVEILVSLLENSAEGVDYLGEAAEVLGYIGRKETVPTLVKCLAHPDEFVAFKAIGALDRIGIPQATKALEGLFASTPSQILKVEVASVLARRGKKEQKQWLLETLQRGPLSIYRSNAATSLGQLGDTAVVSYLRAAFKKDADSIVRSRSALALARLGDEVSIDAIADTLFQTPHESTALVMVEALKVFGEASAVGHLERAVKQSNWRYSLRQRCLMALASLRSKGIGEYLQNRLEHATEISERMFAVEGLGLVGYLEARPVLQAVYKENANHPVGLGAAVSLARMGFGKEFAKDMGAVVVEPDKGFQLQAAEVLGLLRDVSTVPKLVIAARSTPIASVKSAAVKALGEIGHEDAVLALLKLFKTSDSSAAKEEIIEALGKVNSDASKNALLDLLEQTEYASLRIACLRELSGYKDKTLVREFKRYLVNSSSGVSLQAAAGIFYITRQIPVDDNPS
jgi:HEAT repeat protein